MAKYNVSIVWENNNGLGDTSFSNGKYGFCVNAESMSSAIEAAKSRVNHGDRIQLSLLGKNGRRAFSYTTDFFELMSREIISDIITV